MFSLSGLGGKCQVQRTVLRLSKLLKSTHVSPPSADETQESSSMSKDVPSTVNVWRQREKFAIPPIQRFEQLPPKVYYTPEWKPSHHNPLKKYGTTPDKWEFYNKFDEFQTVWPINYVVPETGLPKAREVFHCRESVHYSGKRMWRCCYLINRLNVVEALKQLRYKQIKGCLMLAEVIEEAMERAKNEFNIANPENMFVAEAFPIQERIIKGRKRHARDAWHPVRYRYIHIFVRLEEGTSPSYTTRMARPSEWELMDRYYEYLRNREIKYSL